MKNGQRP